MNHRELETVVLRALSQATNAIDDRPIEPERLLAEQFGLDFSRFVSALTRETGLDIPEADYPQLSTFAGCLDYLAGGYKD